MFVSIDMDRLVFLHKHHDHQTLSGLSWLECGQHTSIRVDNTDADNFLRGVSHSDLLRLYENVIGEKPMESGWGERAFHFREQLREAALNLPPTVALIEEVDVQVAAVDDRLHAGERFKYALGAKVPAQASELFPIQGRPLTAAQISAANARGAEAAQRFKDHLEAERRGDFLPPSARASGGLPPLPGAPPVAPTVSEAPQHEPKAPKARSGSVQPVVFAACDKAWNDPQRVASGETWADVKARLFTQLSDEGFHPTTVRIKLSKWAKEKGL